jgi:hypothetical protein
LSRAVLEDRRVGDEDEQDFLDSDSDSESCHESDTGSDWDSEYDSQGFDKYYDYGDLDETGGNYVVQLENDQEISLEEHSRTCNCDVQSGSCLSISCGKKI